MKVSVNWMKWYGGQGLDAPINELVEKIGAQLGAVDEVINLGTQYKGVLAVKVVSVEDHPNADRLHVCMIDDGGVAQNVARDENGLVQVVCGAPNVRAGISVAWLPPGSTVPESYATDPFVLEARALRGVVSNGMLASPKELAFGDSHDGILEIDQEITPGQAFADVYQLNDYIIDIENKMFTHRPDLFGQLGVAREIAGISGLQFTSPDWYKNPEPIPFGESTQIKSYGVTNDAPELCPRYMLVAVDNIEIKPSPVWMQAYLSRSGIRPINNIVDLTNYMMLLTAQPLHAFDFDKVAVDGDAQITVRQAKGGETLELLNGKTIQSRDGAILICDSSQPIGLAGVMGGSNSEINNNTKRILIECANFDMYNIRKTSMHHGIFSDAVTRFNKGQSALQCEAVLQKTLRLLLELLPNATPVGEIVNSNPEGFSRKEVTVSVDFINKRLGLKLAGSEIAALLQNVEFDVVENGDELHFIAPFWRTDIELAEDIVEEVGRLYGFDKLPLELPKRSITPTKKDALLELKNSVRSQLAKSGANEVLTYSFVHGKMLENAGQDKTLAYELSNALSPDLQYYRLSLTPSLLDKVHQNVKAGYDEFALFEIGKTHDINHTNDESLPIEFERLAFVHASKSTNGGYYSARYYLTQLLQSIGVDNDIIRLVPLIQNRDQATVYYAKDRAASVYVGEVLIGRIGEYASSVQKAFKLPRGCAGFELGLLPLLSQKKGQSYQMLPKFPKVVQDITLKVAADISYKTVYDFVSSVLTENSLENTHHALELLDIYQAENSSTKNVTFRFTISHFNKTMTDKEVNALLEKVVSNAGEINAERV